MKVPKLDLSKIKGTDTEECDTKTSEYISGSGKWIDTGSTLKNLQDEWSYVIEIERSNDHYRYFLCQDSDDAYTSIRRIKDD